MNRKSIFILALVLLLVLVGVTSCESGIDASKQEMEVLKEVLDKATFVQTNKIFEELDNEFNHSYLIKKDEILKPTGSDIFEIKIKDASSYDLNSKVEFNESEKTVSINAALKINLHIIYKLVGSEKVEQLNINGKFTINGNIDFTKILGLTNEDFEELFNVSSKININNKKINVNKDFVQLFNIIRVPTK